MLSSQVKKRRRKMCNKNSSSFNFVFEELSRKVKPCLNLKNDKDAALLAEALTFSKDHCLSVDGCASSRIFANLSSLKDLMERDDKNLGKVGKALKYGLVCPKDEIETFCCDDHAEDTKTGDIFSW